MSRKHAGKKMLDTGLSMSAAFLLSAMVGEPVLPAHAGPSLELGWEMYPSAKLSLPAQVEEKVNASVSVFSWRLGHAWSRSNREFNTHLRYKRRRFNYNNSLWPPRSAGAMPETLYSLDYKVSWLENLSARYATLVWFSPVLENGSEISLKSKDFKFSGGVVLRTAGQRFTIGLGTMWSRDFGRALLLPVLQLAWQDEQGVLALRATLPLEAEMWYAPHPRWHLGLVAHIQGSQFRVDGLAFASADEEEEQVQYALGTFGPAVRLYLFRWIHLNVLGGVSFIRRFHAINDQGERRAREFRNRGFVQLRIHLGRREYGAVLPARFILGK